MSANLMFQSPWVLILLCLPWVVGLFRWWWSRRQLNRYCAPSLQALMVLHDWSWRLLPWRWLTVWSLLVVALAEPMWLSDAVKAQHQPMRWVAVVDVSDSMQANDVEPSRLQQVRWVLEQLAQTWQSGDTVGLYVFSGSHHWLVPMTQDRALWLSGVDMLRAEMLPLKGSLLKPALNRVLSEMDSGTAVLLFTDGGDRADLMATQDNMQSSGLLVGVGTRAGVVQSSVADIASAGKLALPVEALGAFARQLGMNYVTLAEGGVRQVEHWLLDWRKQQPTHNIDGRSGIALQWWFVLFALWGAVGFGKWRQFKIGATMWVLIGTLATLWSVMSPTPSWAQSPTSLTFNVLLHQAQQQYDEKQYGLATQQSMQAFRVALKPEDQAIALELLGLSLMQQSQWFAASQSFRGALAHDSTRRLSAEQLALALQRLPKKAHKSHQEDKAGDRFEGVVSDWDDIAESWETKDALTEAQSRSTVSIIASDKSSSGQITQVSGVLDLVQQQRNDWVLAGEMRVLQQEKRQFYQRLFSLEAGFGAVQEKPQALDGVNPW